jgi:hypothetical protein
MEVAKKVSRRKTILFVAAVSAVGIVAIAVYLVRGNIFDPLNRGRSPVSGEFIDQSRKAIEAKFGPPSHECKGHYGAPPVFYTSQHDPAITVTYERGGGTLYLSFDQREGEWVCFRSDWMPTGWVF